MNDDLDKLLKDARIPERSPGYWENFPKRVAARLNERSRLETAPTRIRWIATLATACVIVALGISIWTRGRSPLPPDYGKLYREVAVLFPNQIRAVIVDEDGVRLELSDKADVPSAPPLRVSVCREQQCRTFITFSGQQIRVDGEPCEVLSDGQGHVLVVGRDLVWTSEEPSQHAGGYHIEGQLL